eukprot:evm.model.NODE_17363_length_20350_cov_19.236412.5
MVVAVSSKRTQQSSNTFPASASASHAAAPPRHGTKTSARETPRPLPSRAAAFIPPLLQQEPHAGEPYREHVKIIPPSKERVARVIKQAHHKMPLEEEEEEEVEEEEEEEIRGVTRTKWQDMEEMVARIERLQREVGDGQQQQQQQQQ